MTTNTAFDHDLVVEDYYGQELQFQEDIYKEENARKLTTDVKWKKTDEGILIIFPENMDASSIKGKVFLYRPSNKKLDFETPISLSNHNLLIPDKRLLDGRWNLNVDWEYNNQSYLYKAEILY